MFSSETEEFLQQHGFYSKSINARGTNGDTALIKAARAARVAIALELISAGADVNITNIDGANAIRAACSTNSVECIKLLAKAGCNIDNQNNDGLTALMYCASSGKLELVLLLLELGADVAVKNLDDCTAFQLAATPEILHTLKNAMSQKLTRALEQRAEWMSHSFDEVVKQFLKTEGAA